MEKAIHRLVVIGVVEDYTLDYAGSEFTVTTSGASQDEIAGAFGRYAGSYQRRLGEQAEQDALEVRAGEQHTLVLKIAEMLIDFVYKHIELARRRSLSEMLSAATRATSGGEDLRSRILQYLEHSEFDERLNDLLASSTGGLDQINSFVDELVSPADAVSLRGSVARLLSSYPDVPGLLLLRGLTEAFAPEPDVAMVEQSIDAAIRFAVDKYRLEASLVAEACAQVIGAMQPRRPIADRVMRVIFSADVMSRPLARDLMSQLPLQFVDLPARWLNDALAAQCAAMRSAV